MKKTNVKFTPPMDEAVDDAHCSSPAQYAMRAEGAADCILMRSVLGPWLTMWRQDRCQIHNPAGELFTIPDIDVVFATTVDGPSLAEIRWLLNCLVDCHVGAESLRFVHEYTGERMSPREVQRQTRRPNDAMLKAASKFLKSTKTCLRNEFARLDEAADLLNAELGNDKAYRARLEKRGIKFWQEHLALPSEKDDMRKARAFGRVFSANWKPSK